MNIRKKKNIKNAWQKYTNNLYKKKINANLRIYKLLKLIAEDRSDGGTEKNEKLFTQNRT